MAARLLLLSCLLLHAAGQDGDPVSASRMGRGLAALAACRPNGSAVSLITVEHALGAGWTPGGRPSCCAGRRRLRPPVAALTCRRRCPTISLLPPLQPGPYIYNSYMASLTTSPQSLTTDYGHVHTLTQGEAGAVLGGGVVSAASSASLHAYQTSSGG